MIEFHKRLKTEDLPPADPIMDELTEQGFFSGGMGSIEIGKLPRGVTARSKASERP